MGLRDYLKLAKESVAAGLRGEGPSPEALASLTPEQRAAYEAQMARVHDAQGETRARHAQLADDHAARFAARPLQGPAGEWCYGPAVYPGMDPADLEGLNVLEMVENELIRTREQVADLGRNPLGRAGPPAASPPAPPEQRDAVAAAERAARDAARGPYVAPERAPHVITRIAARAGDELDAVIGHLVESGLAARPDLVFGCYRVPDHIATGTLTPHGRRYVEWDIVHAVHGADAGAAPSATPAALTIDGREQWVARAAGAPSVLDEDVAIACLASAGIGPDRTFGVARAVRVRSLGGDADDGMTNTVIHVPGVHVIHAPVADGDVLASSRARRPLTVPLGGHPGVHVEVLNWAAIAEAIWPQNHRPVPVPSPFSYLPSSPQELLDAYLDVVGIHPAHCYAAGVVEDEPRCIDGTGTAAGGLLSASTNVGAPSPCVDGKTRRRLFAGTHVVAAYLDTPTYVDGRARWASYERDVLQSNLAAETGARRPVHDASYRELPPGLRGLARGADRLDRLTDVFNSDWTGRFAPHRYCWPPTD